MTGGRRGWLTGCDRSQRPGANARPAQADVAERWDLRESRLIFSIDPKGSEDIDDALSIQRTASGTFEMGVHIADVSAFVQPGSPADLEARARYAASLLGGLRGRGRAPPGLTVARPTCCPPPPRV